MIPARTCRSAAQVLVLMLAALLLGGCGDDDAADGSGAAASSSSSSSTAGMGQPTVLDVLDGDDRFTTFLRLSEAADLVGFFELNNWNHTVFAPTDDAFAGLNPQELRAFESSGTYLYRVLETHVVLDVVPGEDLETGEVPTPLGQIRIERNEEGILFGSAPVVDTDLEASNGLVHAIDGLVVNCTNPLIAREAVLACTIGP